jgi:hypothetical protein
MEIGFKLLIFQLNLQLVDCSTAVTVDCVRVCNISKIRVRSLVGCGAV